MIKNQKQYSYTQKLLTQFENNLAALEAKKSEMNELDFEMDYYANLYQCNELKEEIIEYENIKNKRTKVLREKAIDDLYKVLIQTRIARGWSQSKLAEQLEIDQQQIQRYESSNYESASLARILDIIDVLELKIELKDIALPNPNYNTPETKIIPIREKQKSIVDKHCLFAVGE